MGLKSIKLFSFFLLCSMIFLELNAQEKTLNKKSNGIGLPFIRNYTSDDFSKMRDTRAIVEDNLGIMYFGGAYGVLIYDGVTWENIELTNGNDAMSMAIDHNNKIFVGGNAEMGYLETNSLGKTQYVSLLSKLENKNQKITIVWETIATNDGVYFKTRENLYYWNGEKLKILNSKNEQFKKIYIIRGTLYAKTSEGYGYLNNGKIIYLEGSKRFVDNIVTTILPYKEKSLLFGTYREGVFLYDLEEPNSKVKIEHFFNLNGISHGAKLNNGQFVFGTFNTGISVIDNTANEVFKIDNSNAIKSLSVQFVYQSKLGMLWLGHRNGISKIEYPSPFTTFNKHNGVKSFTNNIKQYNGDIFISTGQGLKVLKDEKFEFYKNQENMAFDFIKFRNSFLVADRDNIKQIQDNNVKEIPSNQQPTSFHISSLDSNRVYVSTGRGGLNSIYFENRKWLIENKLDCKLDATYIITEMTSGDLWLNTYQNWIWNIRFETPEDARLFRNPVCVKFDQEKGLPNSNGNIFKYKNELFFSSNDTYKYNPIKDVFEPASELKKRLKLDGEIRINQVDENENLWFHQNLDSTTNRLVRWNDKTKTTNTKLNQQRIYDFIGGSKRIFYSDNEHVLWLTGKNSVIRHDLSKKSLINKTFNTVINKIFYQGDSLVSYGVYHNDGTTVPFKGNSFRFQYASPSFYEEDKNQFQYKLEGFDNDWSSWSLETKKDYTNIPEGDYIFKVRGENIFGEVSKEDSYNFTILPPWYRTWWAYLSYLLIGLVLLWLFDKWRSQQLKRKNSVLELIVNERTTEIKNKNLRLSEQTERLKELDTMKTRLFANISHEFRTPLTLIKGPIEKLEETQKNKISTTNIKMIRRNANRLLKLVNQLLDLSKLDSGKLRLEIAEGDVFKCIRSAASSFSSHAATRNIDYQIKVPSRLLWASFDRDKLEKILYNLLGNAFKFTNDKEIIIISAEYKNNQLEIKILDTGEGISSKKLPHIFNRFYQVDDSYTKEKEGSGIGLALTNELVTLMKGTIYVESEMNKGSIFKVVIPLEEIKSTSKNLAEEEIMVPFQKVALEPKLKTNSISKHSIKSTTILLVEDHNDMRHFIKEQLQNEYEILEALNGKEGLKKAIKTIPDLIITDLMMPQMDGVTLCKELKTNVNTSHIPVVMLTAKAGIENKLEGLETGADDYLTKPFNTRELLVRVKNLISERQKLRELFSQKTNIDPKRITVTSIDEKFLNNVLELLEEKHTDSQFGVPQMQTALGMSKTQLHRKLKSLTDHPPGELLRNFRLKRAAQLLVQQGDDISQIAYSVGFNSLSYFTRCFRELYSMSPSEYKASKL